MRSCERKALQVRCGQTESKGMMEGDAVGEAGMRCGQ